MNDVQIRPAKLSDADGINAVYNPFIRQSQATFETEEYDRRRRENWLNELTRKPGRPVFVATAGNKILGFANAADFDSRGGYRTSVKTSIFLCPESQGSGLALRLYGALFQALEGTGAHRAYALIVPPNPASVGLHRRVGFELVATLSEVGRKFGRYHDVMWFEKRL
ncbi:MAG: N-acetyltransferase family protein [Pseudomonadota bacterium]